MQNQLNTKKTRIDVHLNLIASDSTLLTTYADHVGKIVANRASTVGTNNYLRHFNSPV